jgi:hypothetical protein
MTPSRVRQVALALVAGLLLSVLAGSPALAAKKHPGGKALGSLAHKVANVPRGTIPKAKKRKLLHIAKHAKRVARKRPCAAVKDLNRFRKVLGGVKVRGKRRARNRLAALGPASLLASRKLLASKRTKRCGGGVKPSTRDNPQVKILDSDTNSLHVRYLLPAVQFVPETGGGQTWTKLTMPDTDIPGTPGAPGIPVVSNKFAVPDGADVTVDQGSVKSVTMQGVDVFPAQPDPVDEDPPEPNFFGPPYKTPDFTIDNKSYDSDSLFPPKPADAGVLGDYRDLTVGGLQVPAGQYNPSDGTLKLFQSVDFTINFNGGTHGFSNELSSPWEFPSQSFLTSLLNFRIIDFREIFRPRRCGEEMLVITNPATLAAANTFADAKRAQGMRTSVFQTGTGTGQIGTTAVAIQSFIRGRLTQFLCIHPSYVTIMGDDDLVPTFTTGPGAIPSDLPYSMRNDTDELPDVAIGRFIGNDNAAITVAVNKVINYENSPPTGSAFLRHATVAAQFQDDNADGREERTFVQFAETVRNGLVGRGVTVDRVYDDSPSTNPLKFNDGTDLPAALQKPTFPWNGSGADVTAAWNAGRFLLVHRDHGYSDGWGTPSFGTAQVDALTNGNLLPVLLSINCSSAAYDYDETSFVGESLVNPNGGAVGAFGDTRDSPTWHNSQIALGFVDALLPSILPAEGPATKQRMGQALINGKLRLAGLAPPSGPGIVGGDGSTRNELYLWHFFGDPSMQMFGGDPPIIFNPNQFTAVFQRAISPGDGDPPYHVDVTLPSELNGQPVSLLQNGQVIGKAIAAGGKASIGADFDNDTNDVGSLQIAIDADGAEPIRLPVQGGTSLTQTCPGDVNFNGEATITGNLGPSVANASITVTWTRPEGRGTVDHPVTTDAQGNWSDTVDTGSEDPGGGGNGGTWLVHATYAGDATHAGSITENCTFQEESG